MTQAIKAMERFYKEDMTSVIEAAAKNAIGIKDDATEEESKVTGYSGYKIENLVLDMIHQMSSCRPFEVVREKEFAPIKNKTGVDSVESARALLEKNGVTL